MRTLQPQLKKTQEIGQDREKGSLADQDPGVVIEVSSTETGSNQGPGQRPPGAASLRKPTAPPKKRPAAKKPAAKPVRTAKRRLGVGAAKQKARKAR